jgi:hypothetical protein
VPLARLVLTWAVGAKVKEKTQKGRLLGANHSKKILMFPHASRISPPNEAFVPVVVFVPKVWVRPWFGPMGVK